MTARQSRRTSLSANPPIPFEAPRTLDPALAGRGLMALIANLQCGWTLFVNPTWRTAGVRRKFNGILYIYRHENLAHPPAGAIVDGLGPRIGPGLMIAAGGGLGGVVWVVNTLTTGRCFST